MPDMKISALSDAGVPAATDELVVVDKSDTTDASTGTNKKVTTDNLVKENPAVKENTAKVGLYSFHANHVGIWRGVSGNPGDSTVLSGGTAQFDSNDVYLSRTDAEGTAISITDSNFPGVNTPLNFAGYAGQVSAVSENSNRIKLTISYTGGAFPLAAQGFKYELFNVADPQTEEHGIYVDNITLENSGDPASKTRVKDGGITDAKVASDAAIAGTKIGAGTLPGDRLTNDSVNASKLQDGSVTKVKVAPQAVSVEKLQVTGTPTDGHILKANSSAPGGFAFEAETGSGIQSAYTAVPLNAAYAKSGVAPTLHTVTLSTGNTLVGHHEFVLNFTFVHTINNLAIRNRASIKINGDALRASSGSSSIVMGLVSEGSSVDCVNMVISRLNDTAYRIGFLNDAFYNTPPSAAAFRDIQDFVLTGITYGALGSAATQAEFDAGVAMDKTPTVQQGARGYIRNRGDFVQSQVTTFRQGHVTFFNNGVWMAKRTPTITGNVPQGTNYYGRWNGGTANALGTAFISSGKLRFNLIPNTSGEKLGVSGVIASSDWFTVGQTAAIRYSPAGGLAPQNITAEVTAIGFVGTGQNTERYAELTVAGLPASVNGGTVDLFLSAFDYQIAPPAENDDWTEMSPGNATHLQGRFVPAPPAN